MVEQKHSRGFLKENPPEKAKLKEFVKKITESKPKKTATETVNES